MAPGPVHFPYLYSLCLTVSLFFIPKRPYFGFIINQLSSLDSIPLCFQRRWVSLRAFMFHALYFQKYAEKVLFKGVSLAVCVSAHRDREHKLWNYIPFTLSLLSTVLQLNRGILTHFLSKTPSDLKYLGTETEIISNFP